MAKDNLAQAKPKQAPKTVAPAVTITTTLDPYSIHYSRPFENSSAIPVAASLAIDAFHLAWQAENAGENETLEAIHRIERAMEILKNPEPKLTCRESALIAVHQYFSGTFPVTISPREDFNLCVAIDWALAPHAGSAGLSAHSKAQLAAARKVESKWGKPRDWKDWKGLNELFSFWGINVDGRYAGGSFGTGTHQLKSVWDNLQKRLAMSKAE